MPKFDIPAGVLAPPPILQTKKGIAGRFPGQKAPKGKAPKVAKKQQQSIADALGLKTSRRKIAKVGARGLRPKGTDWSLDDMGGLFRKSSMLADLILVGLSETSGVAKFMPRRKGAVTFREHRQATIDALRSDDPGLRNMLATRANEMLLRIARIANGSGVHPLDVASTLVTAAGNQAAALGASKVAVYRSINKASAMPLGRNVQLMRSIRASASHAAKAGSALFDSAARFIRSLGGSLFEGIVTTAGMKPWTRQAGEIHGVEIIEFEYLIPSIDADGDVADWRGKGTANHVTAAQMAENKAANSEELKGLLQKTPAGRLWLCWSPKRGGMFLATDRSPGRRIFLSWERSKTDAALLRQSPSKYLSGFVI